MNEESLFELVKEKIGKPIGCCHAKPNDFRTYTVWRWFVLENEEWKEVGKNVIKGLILEALPGKYRQIRYANLVMSWFRVKLYSRDFANIVRYPDL